MSKVRRWLRAYWGYIVPVAAGVWAVFLYFDGRPAEETRSAKAFDSFAPVPLSSGTPVAATPDASPALSEVVTANGGIAVGGNVSGSHLQVDGNAD